MKKQCKICGKEFEAKGSAIYCSRECARENHRIYCSEYMKKRKKKKVNMLRPQNNVNPISLCPKDCKYMEKHGSAVCNYILATGIPRGEEIKKGGCSKYAKGEGK